MLSKHTIDRLEQQQRLDTAELISLLQTADETVLDYLKERAVAVRKQVYGNDIYIRGLIEFSSYCRNDCLYCGIRKSNRNAGRYRLEKEEILACCKLGYELGFRTFVLQSGEDMYYTDDRLCDIISVIRVRYPDCAITLSVGERSKESYRAMYDAGANRYLLRHETADAAHYAKLHPAELTLASRMKCLNDLKEIGYQVGCGFMVGSPYQTPKNLAEDLLFIHQFGPQMVGIGPFIPHRDTPMGTQTAGTLEMTLRLLSILRLMNPNLLLPATTALGTIHPNGRELGILSGANVVMPNLSPIEVREKYLLYDNKICTKDEAAESRNLIAQRMESIGYRIVVDRGDYKQ